MTGHHRVETHGFHAPASLAPRPGAKPKREIQGSPGAFAAPTEGLASGLASLQRPLSSLGSVPALPERPQGSRNRA